MIQIRIHRGRGSGLPSFNSKGATLGALALKKSCEAISMLREPPSKVAAQSCEFRRERFGTLPAKSKVGGSVKLMARLGETTGLDGDAPHTN